MKTKMTVLIAISIVALFLAATASACGSEETDMERLESAPEAPAPAPARAQAAQVQEVVKVVEVPGETVVVEKEVVREVEVEKTVTLALPAAPAAQASQAVRGSEEGLVPQPAQLVSQQRIIIRTVNMSIVVDEIQAAIDDIARIADEAGGWMVSSDHSLKHAGSISIRVPATGLDSVVETLRDLATDVESETNSSQDVTDEYYDLQSRLKNQRATEEALIKLLEKAEHVQYALEVQRELTNVQENIERMLGRIKLLEETSAYSLITVRLSLAPVGMSVDAGPDQSVAAYTPVRFKATFTPPEGMDQHSIVWDFGDGSEPVYIHRTAPTTEDGERVTATVTHSYDDPRDSPFIVQVSIDSFGESGVAEGEDTLIVTASETPVIEVFAGERDYRVLQNEVVEFSGSFTRPPGLSNVRYQWDFGDGSPPEEGEVAEGVTRVDTTHAYPDYRATPYRVKFTITADSAVGEIVSSHEIRARVLEDPGLIVGGFNVDDTAKTAIRTLSLVFSGLTTAVIWIGIFGVIWVPLAVVAILIIRRNRRIRSEPPVGSPNPPAPRDEPAA
ncbi:MAG: DUF4349 domain-containing protein [Dehalococcoidia bacterium]|nr:DUF4349 domain-containing protein [Dehalococcoidia bacterium]